MESKLCYPAFVLLLAAIALFGSINGSPTRYDSLDSRCETITMAMCKDLPYNRTRFPNLLGHETQREANTEITQFTPLININCSPELKSFLCSLYAPVCISMSGMTEQLRPCRHICKRVKKSCIGVLKRYGFKWPHSMRCGQFPKKKNNKLCIDWGLKGKKKGRKGGRKNRKNRKGRKGKGKRKGKKNKRGRKRGKGKRGRKEGKKSKGDQRGKGKVGRG